MRILLARGADKEAKDKDGITAEELLTAGHSRHPSPSESSTVRGHEEWVQPLRLSISVNQDTLDLQASIQLHPQLPLIPVAAAIADDPPPAATNADDPLSVPTRTQSSSDSSEGPSERGETGAPTLPAAAEAPAAASGSTALSAEDRFDSIFTPVKLGGYVTASPSILDLDFTAATGPLQPGTYGVVVQHEPTNERPFKVGDELSARLFQPLSPAGRLFCASLQA